MPSTKSLLPLFIGAAIGIGGILQGLSWRSTGGKGYLETVEELLRVADEEIEALRRENEELRALAGTDREFHVPPELIERAEEELGLTFIAEPVVQWIADDELEHLVVASHESRIGREELELREEAAMMIGWIGPEDRLAEHLAGTDSAASAWFDEASGEGFLAERFSVESVADQAALMGLVARILLHQNFPPPGEHPGDDAARAREALHHGAAALAAERYFDENASPTERRAAGEATEAQPPRLMEFGGGLAKFREVAGKAFAEGRQAQGAENLLAALKTPPTTTRQIFQPDAPAPIQPAPPTQAAGQSLLDESAGQLGLMLWLAGGGETRAAAAELAEAWANDRFQLLDEGLAWDIELADPAAIDRLEPMALARLAAMAGRAAAAASGEWLATPDGRHLRISRPSPTRLTFLNLTEPEVPAEFR